MTATYKVTGLDPGETDLTLGNCLILRRCRDATNTPGMYAKIRNTAMGWMNSPGSVNNFVFFEELFASDVVLDHANPEPRQQGDSMESAELFPQLAERLSTMGNVLSGGEQQMLAIGRALMTNPRLLILDEATEGLAPRVRAEIWRVLEGLRASGLSILIIDKNVDALTRLADRHYVVERGSVVWHGTSAELAASKDVQSRHLGV